MPVMSELLIVAMLLATALSIVAAFYARHAWYFCKDTTEFIKLQNKRSLSLSKLAEIETQLTELTDAYDALLASHKKLRSRIGMRAHRAGKGTTDGGIPDSRDDPAGYKRAMRLKLGAGSLT